MRIVISGLCALQFGPDDGWTHELPVVIGLTSFKSTRAA